ncbi:MAG: hypothetical protein JRJ42_00145 [Deltaproteobacteria bacterium]|nr:hypothetical protein [Deltaproteobacteria bacterium]MBW2018409.1 hypothetical protein [Deltaproteobacteria bacterium]MBW2073695.1 hypothetical protein [Deltaproteobacteria bacterium]RLB83570.1 MAG: hypothetical protein DRH17_01440 [Deltaproteobacteria bacterium]
MIEGIGNVATNLNKDNPNAVQDQIEGLHETTPDVVEKKVNPVESLENLPDESDLKKETDSRDIPNRGSGEEHIIDLLG